MLRAIGGLRVVFLLVLAGYAGAAATAALLWPFGTFGALAAAPFGGSLCAALAGVAVAMRAPTQASLDEANTDAMVANLRALAAEGRRADETAPADEETRAA